MDKMYHLKKTKKGEIHFLKALLEKGSGLHNDLTEHIILPITITT